MFPAGRGRRIVVFVGLYLLLSVPPYLALNWGIVVEVVGEAFPPSPLAAGSVLVGAGVLLGTLTRASAGVDRYARFLVSPTDWLSVLVGLSFVLAAVSWWSVPELLLSGGRVELNLLYFLVFLAHTPMVLFLSLLTAVGLTREAE